MNRYENGKSDPMPEIITRLARELDVSADWLLGLVEDPIARLKESDLSAVERRLLFAYRSGRIQDALRILSKTPEEDVPAVSE